MKKKFSVLVIGITFMVMLFLNVKIGLTAKSENNIQIKNVEALACFTIEHDGVPMGSCCFPYWDTCWVVNMGSSVPGTWTF